MKIIELIKPSELGNYKKNTAKNYLISSINNVIADAVFEDRNTTRFDVPKYHTQHHREELNDIKTSIANLGYKLEHIVELRSETNNGFLSKRTIEFDVEVLIISW